MSWFFVRVPGLSTEKRVNDFKYELRLVGEVHEAQLGTEEDPTAGWFVVGARWNRAERFREVLKDANLSRRIDLVQPIVRIEDGAKMATQLPLF